MKNLNVEQILNKYPSLSRRFIVTYAIACARDALSFIATPDPRSIAALTVTEAYLAGKATDAELVEASNAVDATYAPSSAASYAASYAAYYAAHSAAYAAASRAAYYADSSAYCAAKAAGKHRGEGYYRDMLIDMINKLPLVERIILGVDE